MGPPFFTMKPKTKRTRRCQKPAVKNQLTPAQRQFSDKHSAGLGEWIEAGHNRSPLD